MVVIGNAHELSVKIKCSVIIKRFLLTAYVTSAAHYKESVKYNIFNIHVKIKNNPHLGSLT